MIAVEALSMDGADGALWGTETEDLNATLVRWTDGSGVGNHQNDEVDVIMVVIGGEGEITVDGQSTTLCVGSIVVLPKGCHRSIHASQGELTYVNIHKRRRGLMPNMVRPPVGGTSA